VPLRGRRETYARKEDRGEPRGKGDEPIKKTLKGPERRGERIITTSLERILGEEDSALPSDENQTSENGAEKGKREGA